MLLLPSDNSTREPAQLHSAKNDNNWYIYEIETMQLTYEHM